MPTLYNFLFENNQVSADLEEMPIQQFKTVGDFSKGSSIRSPVDRAILTSPRGVEKIKRQWEKTPFDFDIYVVNDKRVKEHIEIGEVDFEKVVRGEMKITPEEIPDPAEDRITIIFTNNRGTERKMASGWILAHRVSHALWAGGGRSASGFHAREFEKEIKELFSGILEDVYGIKIDNSQESYRLLRYAAEQIGTMKSARDANLVNWYEFIHELLAQYMVTGGIKLNPVPELLLTRVKNWGHKDTRRARSQEAMEDANEALKKYEQLIADSLFDLLSVAINRVYVM